MTVVNDPATGTTHAVRLRGLTKRFGEHTAVQPLDLQIENGEFFSILGPSGCGKTTLMRMITGFETPSGGSVELAGRNVDGVPTRQRDLNMLFQSYALFPHLTVFENVAFELRVRRVPRSQADERVREALDLVRLGTFAQRKPTALSGGQRQRVALARAIVGRPAVVLLDEPLGALDQKLRKEMQFELKRMQREVGITFIYVTHDQEEALTMSDRIAVMSEGRVLQIGTPTEIYDAPASTFVATFIGSCNILDGTVATAGTVEIAGVGPVPAGTTAEHAAGSAVSLAIRPERITISAARPETAGVRGRIAERVFLGDVWLYRVALPGDRIVAVQVGSGQADGLREVADGGEVVVSWREEAARVLDREETA